MNVIPFHLNKLECVINGSFYIYLLFWKQGQEVLPALSIALTHTFGILKKNGQDHWKSTILNDLRALLHRLHQQTKSQENSVSQRRFKATSQRQYCTSVLGLIVHF